mmetsp:Transcript_10610/g.37356  ORF Transcript_10610/g.37356 Transcript_10610/m.37356 type:complete len:271 (-) Transcript_10610:342-1154(-)
MFPPKRPPSLPCSLKRIFEVDLRADVRRPAAPRWQGSDDSPSSSSSSGGAVHSQCSSATSSAVSPRIASRTPEVYAAKAASAKSMAASRCCKCTSKASGFSSSLASSPPRCRASRSHISRLSDLYLRSRVASNSWACAAAAKSRARHRAMFSSCCAWAQASLRRAACERPTPGSGSGLGDMCAPAKARPLAAQMWRVTVYPNCAPEAAQCVAVASAGGGACGSHVAAPPAPSGRPESRSSSTPSVSATIHRSHSRADGATAQTRSPAVVV